MIVLLHAFAKTFSLNIFIEIWQLHVTQRGGRKKPQTVATTQWQVSDEVNSKPQIAIYPL